MESGNEFQAGFGPVAVVYKFTWWGAGECSWLCFTWHPKVPHNELFVDVFSFWATCNFLVMFQRRKSAEDELAMRDYLQEGDLISVSFCCSH